MYTASALTCKVIHTFVVDMPISTQVNLHFSNVAELTSLDFFT